MQIIGNQIIWLNQVESTNDFALEMITVKTPESGTVIATTDQTKGKGQRGNQWLVRANENLCFSIVLTKLHIDVSKIFVMNMAIAVGLRNYIAAEVKNKTVSIKWPNDILIGREKVAGVLIENSLSGSTINNFVIGIGINMNQEVFDFSHFMRKPTSLKIQTSNTYSLKQELDKLLSFLNASMLHFFSGNYERIKLEYHQSLYLLNTSAMYLHRGENIRLTIEKVDELGMIHFVDEDKRLITANVQDLRFLS